MKLSVIFTFDELPQDYMEVENFDFNLARDIETFSSFVTADLVSSALEQLVKVSMAIGIETDEPMPIIPKWIKETNGKLFYNNGELDLN